MKYPVISDNPHIQSFYEQCRKEGTSHNMAEIFALRSAPRSMTDSVLFEGVGTLLDQFEGDERGLNIVLDGAKKHGYTPSVNDYYVSGLCRPEIGAGDPEAFVPMSGGRSYIRKMCAKRGVGCSGAIEISAPPSDAEPEVLGENIVQSAVKQMAKTDPKLLKASKAEQKQEAIKNYAPNW